MTNEQLKTEYITAMFALGMLYGAEKEVPATDLIRAALETFPDFSAAADELLGAPLKVDRFVIDEERKAGPLIYLQREDAGWTVRCGESCQLSAAAKWIPNSQATQNGTTVFTSIRTALEVYAAHKKHMAAAKAELTEILQRIAAKKQSS